MCITAFQNEFGCAVLVLGTQNQNLIEYKFAHELLIKIYN